MALWSLRQETPRRIGIPLEILGVSLVIVIWWAAVIIWQIKKSVLPSPYDVALAFPNVLLGNREVWHEGASLSENISSVFDALTHNVLWNVAYSTWLNVMSYVEAVAITMPLGLAIGLFGPLKKLTERPIAAFRYLPITAFLTIITVWFGISHTAKIQFLTLGLAVYTLLATIQRTAEVEQIYVDMAKSCGATRWQQIKTVFLPLVVGRLSDDLRNLVPITWTYIVLAEGFNIGQGGVGAKITEFSRVSRFEYVFAFVLLISIVGFVEDKLWIQGDRKILGWKYV